MKIETILNENNLKYFLRNPLGIIALFVTICYLIAGLVFTIGLDKLNGATERLPFIWFIIIFPVIIFIVFVLLVCFNHEKLYGPADFKDEANFIKLTNTELQTKYKIEATENSIYEESTPISIENSTDAIKNENLNISKLAYYAENSTHLAVQKLNEIYNTKFTKEVRVGRHTYDAIGNIDGKTYIVECKYIRNITINRLLSIYQQVLRYRESIFNKKPQMIIVCILEKYTEEICVKIKEYYKSIDPNLNIFVFDYNELKTQFKSIEYGIAY